MLVTGMLLLLTMSPARIAVGNPGSVFFSRDFGRAFHPHLLGRQAGEPGSGH